MHCPEAVCKWMALFRVIGDTAVDLELVPSVSLPCLFVSCLSLVHSVKVPLYLGHLTLEVRHPRAGLTSCYGYVHTGHNAR
ncbi:hypothetical protein E2C01_064853 [Portunus trituberculatus]|uniref:Uncharacterized protein n=1 Tax=Portunus trituberculatus TaxID=210409 RepID=A0A5B7HLG6_PORTR|nr:hypothetical protein [Portunus trituberculatus]